MTHVKNNSKSSLRVTPYKVPEDFFDSFREEMNKSLPPYPEMPQPVRLSGWRRFKPYMYLAAMFLGIWCMMKVFHSITSSPELTLENPPEQVTVAMADNDTYDFYTDSFDDTSDIELEDEVVGLYNNIEDFQRDFDYQLKPMYQ